MTEEPVRISQNGTVNHEFVPREGKGRMVTSHGNGNGNGHANGSEHGGPQPSSSSAGHSSVILDHDENIDTVSISISISEAPVAGPSNSARPPFSHVQLGRSEASLVLDVTKDITYVSEVPTFLGILCDVHVGEMSGRGKVALKKLRFLGAAKDEKKEKKFRHEALVWKMLHHPYVLPFYGIYLEIRDKNRIMCLVSPWQKNGNLTNYLRANPDVDRLSMLEKIADALAYLHDNDPPVVHGDIKGQNILVSDDGEPLLCDFGLSMTLENIDPEGVKSVLPTGVKEGGSIRYMSPELIEGKQTKNVASDVFAFAMLIVEAYTMTVPFCNTPNDVTVMFAIVRGDRPECPFSDLSSQETQALWRLMQLCWYIVPRYRPTMNNIAYLLRSLLTPENDVPSRYGQLPKLLSDYVLKGSIEMKELLTAFDKLGGYGPQSKIQLSPTHPLFLPSDVLPTRSIGSRDETVSSEATSEIISAVWIWLTAATQVGLCAALIRKFPSPQKVDATGRKIVPIFGFCVNITLLYYESIVLYVFYIAIIYSRRRGPEEVRNIYAFLRRPLVYFSKSRLALMVVQWSLLTGNSALIIVYFNVKPSLKHVGSLPAICYAYEGLAFYTLLGYTGFTIHTVRSRRRKRLHAHTSDEHQGSNTRDIQTTSVISRTYSPEPSRQATASRKTKGKGVSTAGLKRSAFGLPLRRMRSPGAESRSTTHTADNPPTRKRIRRLFSSWRGLFIVRKRLEDRDLEGQVQAGRSSPAVYIDPSSLYTHDLFVEGSASRPDLTAETRGLQLPPLADFDGNMDFSAADDMGLGESSAVEVPEEQGDDDYDDQDDRRSTMSARQREKQRARG